MCVRAYGCSGFALFFVLPGLSLVLVCVLLLCVPSEGCVCPLRGCVVLSDA
jgi:hypothetical protein